ncbi:hypothetical protein OH76DRAFT_509513 [Lentinus brumalis]|uniref:Uncharacterized protein n=1 Tax=Lentinus brumalis TaxID=2498619 RepID=A0A371DB24_9APHY|nr:hypothetical protein OH76DRAFT_509513 [Polyporus brumalis]
MYSTVCTSTNKLTYDYIGSATLYKFRVGHLPRRRSTPPLANGGHSPCVTIALTVVPMSTSCPCATMISSSLVRFPRARQGASDDPAEHDTTYSRCHVYCLDIYLSPCKPDPRSRAVRHHVVAQHIARRRLPPLRPGFPFPDRIRSVPHLFALQQQSAPARFVHAVKRHVSSSRGDGPGFGLQTMTARQQTRSCRTMT